MNRIFSFSVLPLTELSDHSCTSINIKINAIKPSSVCDDSSQVNVNTNRVKLTYDKNKKHIFQGNVLLTENLNPLITLLNKPEKSKEDLDLSITRLNEVIIEAARKSFPCSRKKQNYVKRKFGLTKSA